MSELLVYSRADKLFCSKLDPGSWKTSQQEKAWSIHTHTQGTVVVCGGQSINTGSSWHWLNLSCNSSIATFLSTAMLIQLRNNYFSSVSTMNKSDLLPAIWTKLLLHLYRDQKVRYSILAKYRERSNIFSMSAKQMQTGSEFKPHYFSWSWGWTIRSSTLPQTFPSKLILLNTPSSPLSSKMENATPVKGHFVSHPLYHSMGRKLLSLPDVSVRITSRLTKSFIPLPLQTPATAIFLPTSPFLRPGISGHIQILHTPLEEDRKKCETVFTNLLSFPYRIEERSFSFSASLVHCSYAVRRLKMTEKTKI